MSALSITDDASIVLITAVPGSGKTLRLVWYIREALRAKQKVYVHGVNGLINSGEWRGWLPFPDPKKWQELPAGSVLIVDEAQDHFPPAPSGAVIPDYLQEMTRIRHAGIRLVVVTQNPSLLHGHLKALVGRHEHLKREDGAEASFIYRRNSLITNVNSDAALAKEDYVKWSFPKDCYDAYKSAQTHTVKRTIKGRYKRGAVALVIAALCIGIVVYRVGNRTASKDDAIVGTDATPGADGPRARTDAAPSITTAADYAAQFTPVIAEMPWTMPATMNREVLVQPTVMCMSTSISCRCMTEQATHYEMPDYKCRDMARYGPAYNPFKTPSNTWNGQVVQSAPPPPQPASVRGTSAQLASSQVNGYGDLGIVNAPGP